MSSLGRNSTQEEWHAAVRQSRRAPDHARAASLVDQAAQRIQDYAREPVLAWSGGKDSLALGVVAASAGVTTSMMVTADQELEYPAFLTWAAAHAPIGLYVEERDRLNLAWLAKHPEMLFPRESRIAARWFRLTQHAGQRSYMKRSGADVLVLGRRVADGNYCGPVARGGAREYQDPKGFTRLSPIWDWTHEDVLNVIAANRVQMPPIYDWPRGFRVGTGPWPSRAVSSLRQGWEETMSIDPDVVERAASAGIPGAADTLRSPQRTGAHDD